MCINLFKQFKYLTLLFFIIFSFAGEISALNIDRPDLEGITTDVTIELFIIDIDSIDDKNQIFVANLFYIVKWKDERLLVEGKDTTYDLNEIWNPRIQFVNQQKLFKSLPDEVSVAQDGTVTYRQRVWGNFSQPLNLRKFPFDHQTLKISIVSANYSPDEVNLIMKKDLLGISKKLSVSNWKIENISFEKINLSFLSNHPSTSSIAIIISADRYLSYYILKFVIPLVLIVLMSFVVFWIDPKQSSTQISISVTSMLTLIAFQYLIGSSLPVIPYLTRMDVILALSTILVFAALVEAATTSILFEMGQIERARSIDYYCRRIFPAIFIILLILPLLVY
jgi:hypothetical protein